MSTAGYKRNKINIAMYRHVYIPDLLTEPTQLSFICEGQEVAIIPTGRYDYAHPRNTLCSGLILNIDGYEPFTAELNGRIKIALGDVKIVYTPMEYILPDEWATRECLDWNSSIVHYGSYCDTTQYECEIEVDDMFDLTKLEFNCLYPISVRVGSKTYRYNKPILVGVSYNGKTYQIHHKVKTATY